MNSLQCRFGDEHIGTDLAKNHIGPINTSWAVLVYLACVIGYLVFVVCPASYLPQLHAFAVQVHIRQLKGHL